MRYLIPVLLTLFSSLASSQVVYTEVATDYELLTLTLDGQETKHNPADAVYTVTVTYGEEPESTPANPSVHEITIIEGSSTPSPSSSSSKDTTSPPAVITTQSSSSSSSAYTPTTLITSSTSPAPSSEATSPGTAPSDSDFKDSVLYWTNYYRSLHGANALTWSDTLASYAQNVANTCVFAHSGGSYGENLAAGTSYTGADSVKAWYDEVSVYAGDYSSASGHFSQLVWKSTTQVGCAITRCPNLLGGSNFIVCEYNPAGNVIGYFAQNVS